MKEGCHLISLPKITDVCGNLSFVEEENHIPFKIERMFWIYDVPGGEERGGHAYKETEDFNYAVNKGYLSIEEVEFAWHKIKEVIRWLRPKRRTIWWRMVNKASKTVNKHLDSLLLKLE